MAIVVLFSWWYTRGWLWVIDITRNRLQTIARVFAVSVLIQTWFSPWKQIKSDSNSFRDFFPNLIDNTVSRLIGGFVRGTILFWALIISIVIILVGAVSLVIWPLIPLMTIILLILTIRGVAL